MDILKQSGKINLMRFYELNQTGSENCKSVVLLTKIINTCVCCCTRDGLIKLNNCSHKQFLERYFKDRMDFAVAVVCHYCHAMLKRIDDFIKQVEHCITQRLPPLYPAPSLTLPLLVSIEPRNITENTDITVVKEQLISPEAEDSKEIKEIQLVKQEVEEDAADSNVGLNIKEEDGDSMADSNMDLNVKEGDGDDAVDSNTSLDETVITAPMFGPSDNLVLKVPEITEVPAEVKPESMLVPNPPPRTDPSTIRNNPSSRPIDVELYGKIQLVMLTREELEKEREETRQSEKYRRSGVRCEDCLLSFVHPYNLDVHMKKHDPSNGNFVCDVCRSVYKSEAALQKHRHSHLRRYQCVPCGKRFKGGSVVCISHYNKAHGADGHAIDKVYKCKKEECDFSTTDYLAFKKHSNSHNAGAWCDECGKFFARDYYLITHKENVHSSVVRIYKCKDCHKEFKTHAALRSHCKRIHPPTDKPVPLHFCNICGRQYKTKLTLVGHLRNHSKHVGDDGRKFICDYCGEKFVFKNRLKDHIEVKHLKTEYKCKDCDKVCHIERSLRRHVQAKHTNQQPKERILCDLCGKGFKTAQILQRHLRTHTGERPFKCSFCSATFGFSAALYTHKRLKHKHPKVRK